MLKKNKQQLKIYFSDFWNGFQYDDNLFIGLLSNRYEVILEKENPDILIFSCYGFNHYKYTCYKIFFTGENVRPNFRLCDFSVTFDFSDYNKRNMRLPLVRFNGSLEKFTKSEVISEQQFNQKKFCCMVVSNPDCSERNLFYEMLSKKAIVDSAGRYKNNIGNPVEDKLAFLKNYKFVICFENSSFPGYTTEKILDVLNAGSVPIYWGNSEIQRDFNSKRFVNVHDYSDFDSVIKRVLYLNSNYSEYKSILSQNIFPEGQLPKDLNWNTLQEKFLSMIEKMFTQKPVAQKNKMYAYVNKYKKLILSRLFNKPHWYL